MVGLARSGSGWVAGCFLVGLWGGSQWWSNSRSTLGGFEMSCVWMWFYFWREGNMC